MLASLAQVSSCANPRALYGGKAAHLADLAAAGFAVPEALAIDVREYERHEAALDDPASASAAIRPELAAALLTAVGQLGGLVAIRSSATCEDGSAASFAGLFETVLCVTRESVLDAVWTVWRSAKANGVRSYMERLNVTNAPLMGVVVQRQLDSAVAGVAIGDATCMYIESVFGQGEAVVSGDGASDAWLMKSGRIVDRRIAAKTQRLAVVANKLQLQALPEHERRIPSLTDAQLICLYNAVLAAGRGQTVDVEFAFAVTPAAEERALFLLQARPATASLPDRLEAAPDGTAEGRRELVGPSAARVFGRRVAALACSVLAAHYVRGALLSWTGWGAGALGLAACVAACAAAALAVEARTRAPSVWHTHSPRFGVLRPPGSGAWRLDLVHQKAPATALFQEVFPDSFRRGFQRSAERYGVLLSHIDAVFVRGFLYTRARPLGAPEDATASAPPPAFVMAALVRLVPQLRERAARAELVFPNKEAARQRDEWIVDRARSIATHLRLQSVDCDALTDAALESHLDAVLAHWREMITQHHAYNLGATLPQGDLLAHVARWSAGQVSKVDVLALTAGAADASADWSGEDARALARAIAGSAEASACLAAQPVSETDARSTLHRLRALPAVATFLERRECRPLDGLDVACVTLGEDPLALLGMLRKAVAAHGDAAATRDRASASASASAAEAAALTRVRQSVPREHWTALDELIAEARAAAALRDDRALNSDIWATGIVRRVALAFGRRIIARQQPRSPYLECVEHAVFASSAELRSLLAASAASNPLATLVSASDLAERAHAHATQRVADMPSFLGAPEHPPPAITYGGPGLQRVGACMSAALFELFAQPIANSADSRTLSGRGASAGRARGRVTFLSELAAGGYAAAPADCVLVITGACSNFTMYAPAAIAIVAESGGLLSHCAIVAREYGLPCVVGVSGACSMLRAGDCVTVDGTAGTVARE